jgi:DNA-binding transcriptional MerR regulator
METTDKVQIPDRLYFRIGDVSELVGVKAYVLRYWETEFPMISPQKTGTGQRVYRRGDVETVLLIKHLLYEQRYSIEGARKKIRELRREGEFKNFKQETIAATSGPAFSDEGLKDLHSAAKDILESVKAPITDLFHF